MKQKLLSGFATVLLVVGIVGTASATLITDDLAFDTYITQNGLDWTWASPVNQITWGDNQLMTPDFHDGWRYATDYEFTLLPDYGDFLRVDGSVIQSVQYWNTIFTHVDTYDFMNGYVNSSLGHGSHETVYVRDANAPVPEPATMLLLGSGLFGLAGFRRKKS